MATHEQLAIAEELLRPAYGHGLVVDDTLQFDGPTQPTMAELETAIATASAHILSRRVYAEFARRIAAVIGRRRASVDSWLVELNTKRMDGGQLSAEEQQDRALILAFYAWEGLMIETRETLIAGGSAAWPPPPAGLTPEWLKGF